MRKRWFSLALAVLLGIALMLAVRADFGGFSGDSDYGGSSDYGYDYDYDYDYDTGMGYYGDSDDNPTMVIVVAVILLGYAVVSTRISKGGGHRGKNTGTYRGPVHAGAARTDDALLRPISEYVSLDASFDEAEFREMLSNLYVQMQNQWTARDLEPLRPYFTDALYTQMERQVQQLKKAGRTNHVDRISVLGVTLRGFRQQGGEDHMIAELQTRIVDYTVNDADGRVISGSDSLEKFMTYEWELTRTTGSASSQAGASETIVCPNCGAPVDINASARCAYCGSVLHQDAHGWAICAIRGISQVSG